jgi:hypothetical protein
MNDLIDLGNLVFDELLKNHGEQPTGRELFLYSLTHGQPFYLLGSDKRIVVTGDGVSKNFEDSAIEALDKQWKAQIQAAREKIASEITKRIKSEDQQPKDGDIFNFWSGEGNWREIKF